MKSDSQKVKDEIKFYLKQYEYRVVYSSENECFVATVVELRDCSGLGDTKARAIEEAETSAFLVLNYYKDVGLTIPEPVSTCYCSGKFNIRISPDLHRRLSKECMLEDLSLNKLVSDILNKYVDHRS